MKCNKVKIIKRNYRLGDYFYYELFLSEKRDFWGKDLWKTVETYFPSAYVSDAIAKERAIKDADNLLKPKESIMDSKLKLDELIYEKTRLL